MRNMPRICKFISLLLVLGLMLCLTSCGSGSYRKLESLGTEEMCFAYRYEDKLSATLEAALSQVIASGEAGKLSQTWLGESRILSQGDADALSLLPELAEERILIMGVVVSGEPYAFYQSGNLTGFVPELARAVAAQLGWGITFQEITPADACAQLGSGNIDCAVCLPSSVFSTDSYTLGTMVIRSDYVLATLGDSSAGSFHALKNGSIALMEGDSVTESLLSSFSELEKYSIGIRFYSSAEAAVNAVVNGDAQAVAMDETVLEYLAAAK